MQAAIDIKPVLTGYSAALRRLGQMTGFKQQDVLRAEAGSILKTWAGRTKVATLAQIDRRERLRAIKGLGYTQAPNKGDVTVNAGFKPAPFGRVWIRVSRDRKFALARAAKFAPSGNRFGKLWEADIRDAELDTQAAIARRIPIARRSAGLARQSVVQIADSLGIDLDRVAGGGVSGAGLAKARAAMASNGRAYKNGSGVTGGTDTRPYIDLLNGLPYAANIGMDRTLVGVIAGRAKMFDKIYSKGAFDSFSRVARAFPNLIKVSQAA